MDAPRSAWLLPSTLALACWILGANPAAADSILAGTVTDAITHQPVAGAKIDIEYSGHVLGSGTSDVDGIYSISFTMPPSLPTVATMITSAGSQNHEISISNFQVNNGTPVETDHNILLFPLGVTACRSQAPHSIIVGHFLPPVGRDFSDLPIRVARSLDFALNPRLQIVRLSPDLQPSFEPCDAAKPITPKFGGDFAKALRADAFVTGDISGGPSNFTVSTYISDAYDLFGAPTIATSRNVDLSNPSGASIAADTYVAVLAAIAAGLAQKDNCAAAITVLSIAEQLVEVVPPYISALRKTCQARLPNAGLVTPSP
jgi:hypothetical protein